MGDSDNDFDPGFIALNIRVHLSTGKVVKGLVTIKETIDKLKLFIESMEGIPPNQQKMFRGTTELEDDQTWEDYGILTNDEGKHWVEVDCVIDDDENNSD